VFEVPVSPSTVANQRIPDKAKLKETILALRAMGWSYREIAREVELHWTRVEQILRQGNSK
jgi:DNA-directed RNA polymerase specialized sigma24 family protein